MKLATLIAAATLTVATASFGQGTVIFDNVSVWENSAPSDAGYAAAPDHFVGGGYTLTPGTTNITGFDLYPVNGSATTFAGLNAIVYIWGSVNQTGTVNSSTPAFGNLLAKYTLAIPPGEIPPPGGYVGFIEALPAGSAPGLVLPTPLAISGTNIGITINYQGSTDGINYSSVDDLTSLITYSNAPTVGSLDFNGFYLDVNSEVNGNFIGGLLTFGYTFQGVGMRVYGNVGPLIPTANSQSVNVLKNTSKSITLTGSVPGGDPITYIIVNNPTNGTLSGTPPNVTYTPNANYTGADAFTFKVYDGSAYSTPATVSLNVSALAGLIIVPTWDTTILTNANVVSITNTLINTILTYETRFSDPVIVNITFAAMSTGLGQSSTFSALVNYSDFYNALVASAKTTNDTVVLAHLPNASTSGSTNPVTGSTSIRLTTAHLRALGFNGSIASDATISLNMSIINITRPPTIATNYDLQAVASHEIDEVLGTISGVNQADIRPADLFRFSGPGTRNYTTSGDSAFFSIDGGNTLLVQYNQNSQGDYGDWWSTGAHTPRVQDAFGTPNSAPDLGVELTALDSVGWTLVSAIPLVVPQPIVHVSQSNTTMVLRWNSAVGAKYQVQYTTNLVHTNWVSLGGPITASTTTTTNIDSSLTNPQRFYRVQVLPSSSVVLGQQTTSQKPVVNGPFSVYKHVTHPRSDLNPGSAQLVAPGPVKAIPVTSQDSP